MASDSDQTHPSHYMNGGIHLRSIRFQPAKIVFYLVFAFITLLSGLIILLDIFPYRLGLVSFLVIPLLFIYGIKIDKVLLVYVGLAGSVIISGIYNNSSLLEIFLFLRILAFSYLIYYLVEVYINKGNIQNVFKLCIIIAVIQLPIIVLQQMTYDYLPESIKLDIVKVKWDFAFGTFRPGDSALNFFVNLLLIFLLFDRRRNYFIKHKTFLIIWLSLTVLASSSEISKVTLAFIWGAYLITHLKRKTTIYLGIILLVLLLGLIGSGLLGEMVEPVKITIDRAIRDFGPERVEQYLEGRYARGAALYYFFTNDILWLGDGPSKYSDPISSARLRGNMGHIYTFYSEVGLIGWLLSVMVYFLIAFRPGKGMIRYNAVSLLIFAAVQILSFTNNIMNDISVVLVYCILAKTYLLPTRSASPLLRHDENIETDDQASNQAVKPSLS
jgi:hypothetical protein